MDAAVRQASLDQVLDDLLSTRSVAGAVVLTASGRILAGRAPDGVDPGALAREYRTLVAAGSVGVASRGDLVRVDLRGTRGSTVVMRIAPDLILAVMTATRTPEALSLELSRAAAALGRLAR